MRTGAPSSGPGDGEIGEFGSHAGVVDMGGVVAGSEAACGVGGGGDGGGDASGDQDSHGGRVFFFAGKDTYEAFRTDPDKYAPPRRPAGERR